MMPLFSVMLLADAKVAAAESDAKEPKNAPLNEASKAAVLLADVDALVAEPAAAVAEFAEFVADVAALVADVAAAVADPDAAVAFVVAIPA